MLNQRSFETVSGFHLSDQFVLPAYNASCFSQLPDTIRRNFDLPAKSPLPEDVLPDGRRYQQVILFFIDGLGWRFVQQYLEEFPFLRRFLQQGVVSQMTSMFPSTTAAHTTCIHTGLDLAQNGIYEWYYYEPDVDLVVSPLIYSVPGIYQRDWLAGRGVTPQRMFPFQSFYQELQAQGIQSTVFQSRDYATSAYSTHVCRGAEMIPYLTWNEALVNLELLLGRNTSPAYYFLYLDSIDAIMHRYGPGSRQAAAEIRVFLMQMENFVQAVAGRFPNTLLLLSADHGQAEISPANTLYLNRMQPDFEKYFKVDRLGQPVILGGSARDLFLYIRDEVLEEVQALLSERLAERAEVYRTDELLEKGAFGPVPAKRLLERLGNLVVLPYNGYGVFWYQPGKYEQKFYGHHGGLTPEEMYIPLLALEL